VCVKSYGYYIYKQDTEKKTKLTELKYLHRPHYRGMHGGGEGNSLVRKKEKGKNTVPN